MGCRLTETQAYMRVRAQKTSKNRDGETEGDTEPQRNGKQESGDRGWHSFLDKHSSTDLNTTQREA